MLDAIMMNFLWFKNLRQGLELPLTCDSANFAEPLSITGSKNGLRIGFAGLPST